MISKLELRVNVPESDGEVDEVLDGELFGTLVEEGALEDVGEVVGLPVLDEVAEAE